MELIILKYNRKKMEKKRKIYTSKPKEDKTYKKSSFKIQIREINHFEIICKRRLFSINFIFAFVFTFFCIILI